MPLHNVVVGLEVLVGALGNLVHSAVRGFRRIADRLLRREGGLLDRILGLVGFVLLVAALGFLALLVGLFSMSWLVGPA